VDESILQTMTFVYCTVYCLNVTLYDENIKFFSLWKKFATFEPGFGSGSGHNECGSETLGTTALSIHQQVQHFFHI
jgi:hypothetical protein